MRETTNKDREKCMEKLNQMQKYLPFLDFMIDRINKKNDPSNLKNQLTKLQHLKSMISEKSGKQNLEVLNKVEDVIEKLIYKLDYKDRNLIENLKAGKSSLDGKKKETGESKRPENRKPKDSGESKASSAKEESSAASSSSIPTSTSVIPASSQVRVTSSESKVQDASTVDLIMKTLKKSVDPIAKTDVPKKDPPLTELLGSIAKPLDKSPEVTGMDLDKDLDGFDLTETTTSGSEPDVKSTNQSSHSNQSDLLASSRQKLLKSVQKLSITPKSDQECKNDPKSDNSKGPSAESDKSASTDDKDKKSRSSRNTTEERKTEIKSPERKKEPEVNPTAKEVNPTTKEVNPTTKEVNPTAKEVNPTTKEVNPTAKEVNPDLRAKQKLRERLSADVAEVHKVPGKSIGGSLRSLKENRKSFLQEEELFKPDEIKSVVGKTDEAKKASIHDPRIGKTHKIPEKVNDKKEPEKKPDQKKPEKKEIDKLKNSTGTGNDKKKDVGDCDLGSLDDKELSEFVKENMSSLPHLAKMNSGELRKAVQSLSRNNLGSSGRSSPTSEALSSITSEDDLDDFLNKTDDAKSSQVEPHPLAKVKMTNVGKDGIAKVTQTLNKRQSDDIELENIGDKTHADCSESDDEDFKLKLIEDISPVKTMPKKKGILELPLPDIDESIPDIPFLENDKVKEIRVPPSKISPKPYGRAITTVTSEWHQAQAQVQAQPQTQTPAALMPQGFDPTIRRAPLLPTPRLPMLVPQFNYSPLESMMPNLPPLSGIDMRPNYPRSHHESYPQQGYDQRYMDVNDSRHWQFVRQATNYMGRSHHLTQQRAMSYGEYKQQKLKRQQEEELMRKREERRHQQYADDRRTETTNVDHRDPRTADYKDPRTADYKDPRTADYKDPRSADYKDPRSADYKDPRSADYKDPRSADYKDPRISADPKSSDPAKNLDDRQLKNSSSLNRTLEDKRQSADPRQRRYQTEPDRYRDKYQGSRHSADRRQSTDSDELKSPLEQLYQGDDKPKTGRGYGLQNFKIPKKNKDPPPPVVREPMKSPDRDPRLDTFRSEVNMINTDLGSEPVDNLSKQTDNGSVKNNEAQVKTSQKPEPKKNNETKAKLESSEKPKPKSDGAADVSKKAEDATKKRDAPSKTTNDSNKTDVGKKVNERRKSGSSVEEEKKDKLPINDKTEEKAEVTESKTDESKTEIDDKTEKIPENPTLETKNDDKEAEDKVKPEVPEKRSEPEKNVPSENAVQDSAPEVTKPEVSEVPKKTEGETKADEKMSKDEITKEFVEAIILKSFESGECKVLLEQSKLFEKFVTKLTPKKLKTIQKLINSDNESSSSSDSSSEDEKKKKTKKERRSKKRKKKTKRRKRSSDSSSVSSDSDEEDENEEQEEEESETKEGRAEAQKKEPEIKFEEPEIAAAEEDKETEKPEIAETAGTSVAKKVVKKKRRRCLWDSVNYTNKKRRQQRQQKLLLQVLEEEKSKDNDSKAEEQKAKAKPKSKVKTELDRLHEDIRSMFISSGVVTATGQRMCRMYKESGGNLNNLDIVKESAKMVEEEKLKNVTQTRTTRNRKPENNTSQSRSRDLSKNRNEIPKDFSKNRNEIPKDQSKNRNESPTCDENYAEKVKPCKVLLTRIDLDRYGYAYKISSDPDSCKRSRGRNVARTRRKFKSPLVNQFENPNNIYLRRNLRKVRRLKSKEKKRIRERRKLVDVIKKLTEKASETILTTVEIKTEKPKLVKRRKVIKEPSKKPVKTGMNLNLGQKKLINYAFDKKKALFECLLCSNVSRSITAHYKNVHPDSEVLISRLGKAEAEKAVADSKENNYDVSILDKAYSSEMIRRRVKSKLAEDSIFTCRMCNAGKIHDVNQFFTHVSTHTGEYRFKCPAEGCSATTPSRDNMKYHILSNHAKNKQNLYAKILELFPMPSEHGNLYGYLCSKCNFVQIMLRNVEKHVATFHGDEDDVEIVKIDMSGRTDKEVQKKPKSKSEAKKAENQEASEPEEDEIEPEKSSQENSPRKQGGEEGVESVKRRTTRSNARSDETSAIESLLAETKARETVTHGKRKRKTEIEALLEDQKKSSDEENDEDAEFLSTPQNESDGESKKSEVATFTTCLNDFVRSIRRVPIWDRVRKSLEEQTKLKTEEKGEKSGRNEDDEEDSAVASSNGAESSQAVEKEEKYEAPPLKKRRVLEDLKDGAHLCREVQVGPLEAKMLVNMEIIYECYVKGCIYTSFNYDSFEQHILITHTKTKWDGKCQTCRATVETEPDNGKFLKLSSALKHLKSHEKDKEIIEESTEKIWTDEIKKDFDGNDAKDEEDYGNENKMETKLTDKEDKDDNKIEANSDRQDVNNADESKKQDVPYPVKPLLRVRSLLGDRLSKPKNPEELSSPLEEPSRKPEAENASRSQIFQPAQPEPAEKSLFTIEDVRSLKPITQNIIVSPQPLNEPGNIRIVENVRTLPESGGDYHGSGKIQKPKSVLIRPGPNPKFAIRSAPQANLGHIKVVPITVASSVSPPVLFTSLPNTSPIRLISTPVTMQSVIVSHTTASSPSKAVTLTPATAGCQTSAVVYPTKIITDTQTNSAILTDNPLLTQTVIGNKPPFDVLRNSSSPVGQPQPQQQQQQQPVLKKVPPTAAVKPTTQPKMILPKPDGVEINQDECSPFRRSSNSFGGKNIKDAKIYQEMLTKSKLCQLFKCMAVECSFTCNDESVFTQHIGLHEAQQRMKSQRKNLKAKKVFNWQQCAYCCEVLMHTGSALSRHIITEHGHCLYQCAYCFYRAVSLTYVELHQKTVHTEILKDKTRLILKCKPIPGLPPPGNAVEKQTRRQSVRPYHCDQCGMKFFITQDFMDHLAKEHQSVTAYTCHICKNLCFKADRLIAHYKLHSYSMFQCAYCLHGTETQKEMLFHLCNFHFSQPAYMYVRALAKDQKGNTNHLDALKVVSYENDSANSDNIIEADTDENDDSTANGSLSINLTAIVSELIDYADDTTSANNVTPIMKELIAIDHQNPISATVESLLPNAQFSNETETSSGTCTVIVSPTKAKDDKAPSVPIGQLSLEDLGVQKDVVASPNPPKEVTEVDKTLKLNEILVNLHQKDKSEKGKDETSPSKVAGVHRMPPTVAPGRVYPAKGTIMVKRTNVETEPNDLRRTVPILYKRLSGSDGKESGSKLYLSGDNLHSGLPCIENVVSLQIENSGTGFAVSSGKVQERPVIANVVSMTSDSFDAQNDENLSQIPENQSDKIVINIQSPDRSATASALQPPIIRVEDFKMEDQNKQKTVKESLDQNTQKILASSKRKSIESVEVKPSEPNSDPEIIILEDESEKSTRKDVIEILDSDDETPTIASNKRTLRTLKKPGVPPKKLKLEIEPNDKIRKEMELLRNKMADETDCLLFDETSQKSDLLTNDNYSELSVNVDNNSTDPLLSPIERAIFSLNKKLESEKPQSSDDDSRKGPEKSDRTDKSSDKDGNKSESNKKSDQKAFLTGLAGEKLYLCGIGACDFAAETDSELKDHLHICDCSRNSSILICPHCNKQLKLIAPYVEHLKLHGEIRYSCGLCDYKGAIETSVIRHLKLKHKITSSKTVPKESASKGFFVVYPRNHKAEKSDFETKGYSPGDEDKLPLQSVYQVNVKCAVCPYYTKVRSNMVRHLKIHAKSMETEGVLVVPSTAPTNPVPCLDTKERMFDKMTNLAASSQLAQAKERTPIESLTPEEEARLPKFVPEQFRYKCCSPDCNYLTIDDNMLRHHIKALHDEISHYSCPHCSENLQVEFRHVPLEKIGLHLKYHDSKLYKCAHCNHFHHQKHIVEKHVLEKHPERRFFLHTVREPKADSASEDDAAATAGSSNDASAKAWRCGFCNDFESFTRMAVLEHVYKVHNSKSKYKCKYCDMKTSQLPAFGNHFASKHNGEKVAYVKAIIKVNANPADASFNGPESSGRFDTTPLWQRYAPRVRHIRGILIEEEEVKTKKSRKASEDDDNDGSAMETNGDTFYCPLCADKKKVFRTKSPENFRSHLYQELNYQQFACILCGKMFVDRRDFEKHHGKSHPDQKESLNQTKEDKEIIFWVEKVIAKQLEQMQQQQKRKSEEEKSPAKKKRSPPKTPEKQTTKTIKKAAVGSRRTRSTSSEADYEKTYTCRHCRVKVNDVQSLKVHIKVTHLKLGRWLCAYCDTSFQTESLAGKHCRYEHPDETVKININAEALKHDVTDEFWRAEYGIENGRLLKNFVPDSFEKCKFCPFRDTPEVLKKHETSHATSTQFKCRHCDLIVCKREKIMNHVSNAHPGAKMLFSEVQIEAIKKHRDRNDRVLFACALCPSEYKLEAFVIAHLKAEHGLTRQSDLRKECVFAYKCSICEHRTDKLEDLTRHEIEVHDEPTSKYEKIRIWKYDFEDVDVDVENCAACSKHDCECTLNETEDGTEYSCPWCEYKCSRYEECMEHFNVHYPSYTCKICSEKFETKEDVEEHFKESDHSGPFLRNDPPEATVNEYKATIVLKNGRFGGRRPIDENSSVRSKRIRSNDEKDDGTVSPSTETETVELDDD